MNGSRTAHGGLTEDAVSDSLHAHVSLTPGREGKGREGNREGKGRTAEGSGHSFSSPTDTRESATDHDALCCFPPCPSPKASGSYFCEQHARRWNRGGTKQARKDPPLDRFRATGWTETTVVSELGPCWEWNGSRNIHGYGNFIMPGARSAHRAAYLLTNGAIPAGAHILHGCDNPPCVNPSHLRAGTRSDNMLEMASKGRHPYAHRKISDEDVRSIRARYTGARGEQVAIAREYGVSSNQINLIVRGLARRKATAPGLEVRS